LIIKLIFRCRARPYLLAFFFLLPILRFVFPPPTDFRPRPCRSLPPPPLPTLGPRGWGLWFSCPSGFSFGPALSGPAPLRPVAPFTPGFSLFVWALLVFPPLAPPWFFPRPVGPGSVFLPFPPPARVFPADHPCRAPFLHPHLRGVGPGPLLFCFAFSWAPLVTCRPVGPLLRAGPFGPRFSAGWALACPFLPRPAFPRLPSPSAGFFCWPPGLAPGRLLFGFLALFSLLLGHGFLPCPSWGFFHLAFGFPPPTVFFVGYPRAFCPWGFFPPGLFLFFDPHPRPSFFLPCDCPLALGPPIVPSNPPSFSWPVPPVYPPRPTGPPPGSAGPSPWFRPRLPAFPLPSWVFFGRFFPSLFWPLALLPAAPPRPCFFLPNGFLFPGSAAPPMAFFPLAPRPPFLWGSFFSPAPPCGAWGFSFLAAGLGPPLRYPALLLRLPPPPGPPLFLSPPLATPSALVPPFRRFSGLIGFSVLSSSWVGGAFFHSRLAFRLYKHPPFGHLNLFYL